MSEDHDENYLPIWLQDAGYNTYCMGGFRNAHTTSNYNKPYPKRWNGTDCMWHRLDSQEKERRPNLTVLAELMDTPTYSYWNSTFQHNYDAPVASDGYSSDLISALPQLHRRGMEF